MIGWFLWAWSNIAFLGALAGLVGIWWLWPRLSSVGFPVAFLIAVSAVLGGFGWGELRYADGREAGGAVERAKWEKSFNKLKEDSARELKQANDTIETIRSNFVAVQAEKEAAKNEAAISNARILAIINNEPQPPRTIICEKANEQIAIPACPNPYSLRVDSRIVRNLQGSRNQNGTRKGSK